ncbi:MAG: polynucleotide adenylyltransferase PcnB [Candidatus Thiodiazotropha lotti]|uniref:polynucleotide adenylyltransferase PcnB n=1 Tax=Candidatus Thiodiazotropha endoloripes TaxID=1818881 RepID=UPI0009F6546C|nr:polynucleotide adenylyltransferase PcnB [Candidatus Thiodiazotropha weberae]MCG7990082.1 polynucleotide adenylyltransferase PcnB [Candidatus Thiodiazotropha lotti]MCG7903421.1 polynucleotide adenylyltransferase PcnB [Candidatus Thiodiazotropha weberae]MCG7915585.1 polynucleotide adenylyltransferase PcnB [Candidatus Thiodiazotropha weberae]MCG8000587.1 polynucleotide adenylyltransferase PcnB [Candidatus Thiodiazotropha lotti]
MQATGLNSGDSVSAIQIPRNEHNISRANISNNAIKVLTRLSKSGYEAYLVGGGVRDLLLGREPKDFDVATNARPEEVKQVFNNCRLIGRRFRLAHVHFGREIIEVATFRSNQKTTEAGDRQVENGMILRDNVYGTLEEDAQRRDFTINALYYNIDDFSVVDFANGMVDLQQGVIRLLGDVESRYREDPVRLLRAIRFAAKLGFVIEPATEAPIARFAPLLGEVPSARLYEEVLKLFLGGAALESFEKLRHYELFGQLFPATEEALSHEDHEFPITFVNRGMANTDDRLSQGKSVTPAFLFAVLLWEPVRLRAERFEAEGAHPLEALQNAAAEVLSEQAKHVSIPKRFSYPMRDIWQLQARFTQRQGKRPQRLASHPKFRAAYDFLLLRAESGEVDQELADWWTLYQHANGEEKVSMTEQGRRGRGRRRRKRRKKTQTVDE